MCRQAWPRMTFTSHTLLRTRCWSFPRSAEASKRPFASLNSGGNSGGRESVCLLACIYRGRVSKPQGIRKGFGQSRRAGWGLRQGHLSPIFSMQLSASYVSPTLTWACGSWPPNPLTAPEGSSQQRIAGCPPCTRCRRHSGQDR